MISLLLFLWNNKGIILNNHSYICLPQRDCVQAKERKKQVEIQNKGFLKCANRVFILHVFLVIMNLKPYSYLIAFHFEEWLNKGLKRLIYLKISVLQHTKSLYLWKKVKRHDFFFRKQVPKNRCDIRFPIKAVCNQYVISFATNQN